MQLSNVPGASVAQTLEGYGALAEQLGYPYFHVSAQLERVGPGPLEAVLSNVPNAWVEARKTSDVPDPLSFRMQHSIDPFGWDELSREHPDVAAFFDQAAAHGLHDGVCLPVRCTGSDVVAVTFAGASPPAIGPARTGHFQQIWSYTLHMIARLRDLLTCLNLLHGSEHMTERQRRVVTLVAEGQKFDEIAVLLGVHRRTVEGTFYGCLHKFGVGSREALLMRAFAAGQIKPAVTLETVHLHQLPWRNL